MFREVAFNCLADRGKERLLTEVRVKAEALQLVLDWIFHLGKIQLDARRVQRVIEFGDGIGCGDIDTGNGLGRDHKPSNRSGRARNGVEHTIVEELGVREKERCIPPKQHEARDQTCIRISSDVVIPLHVVNPTEHG